MGQGLNRSILFMLTMTMLIPIGFGLAIWNSYRQARLRAEQDPGA